MKTRDVVIFSGQSFTVPQGIQRIDTRSTHGWQVRYHGTKMFSDHSSDGSGAAASLEAATRELLRRIAQLPAPVLLQKGPSVNKQNRLPAGISGPIVRERKGSRTRTASLSVLVPRFGREPQIKNVYIGTETTYTVARYRRALARALELRREAVERYEIEATRARRKAAREFKAAATAGRAKSKAA
jgi:hypothetical protein